MRPMEDAICRGEWFPAGSHNVLAVHRDQFLSNIKLRCGQHLCPSKCHKYVDHSQMACEISIERVCSNGHKSWMTCHKATANPSCVHCDRELKRARDEARREAERQAKRDAEKAEHDAKIDALDAEIAKEQAIQRDHRLKLDRERALKQRAQDLEDARSRTQSSSQPVSQPQSQPFSNPFRAAPSSSSTPPSPSSMTPPASSTSSFVNTAQSFFSQVKPTLAPKPATPANLPPPSPAETEWKRQKRVEGASSSYIDSIMGMIGLEKVKQQVLDTKAKLELAQRQGISTQTENLNCALLGNPGTGELSLFVSIRRCHS